MTKMNKEDNSNNAGNGPAAKRLKQSQLTLFILRPCNVVNVKPSLPRPGNSTFNHFMFNQLYTGSSNNDGDLSDSVGVDKGLSVKYITQFFIYFDSLAMGGGAAQRVLAVMSPHF